MSRRYVLLDRDGVINEDSDNFIKSAAEWRAIPGSLEAIALLYQNGFNVAVISNQSGLGRKLFTQQALDQIHQTMQQAVMEAGGKIDIILYCPHHPQDNCTCRKPKPGLLNKLVEKKQLDLSQSYFIGDSLRDIQAAQAAGAKPILVKTGKGLITLANTPNINTLIFDNLYDASQFILSEN